MECGVGLRCIQEGVDVADVRSQRLIDERKQAGPKRSDGAGATNHRLLAVDDDVVTCLGIGLAGNIRHTAADESVGSLRDFRRLLEWRKRENFANATAGGALTCRKIVPSLLAAKSG